MTAAAPSGRALPAEFVDRLRALLAAGDTMLDHVLVAANRAGWTQAELANALGFSRQWVMWRITRWRRAGIPRIPVDVPNPPHREPKPYKIRVKSGSQKWVGAKVPPEIAEELRSMEAEARLVNGVTPADDPRRIVSVALSKRLADLHDGHYSYQALAEAMGVCKATVRARLARHGYRTLPPSVTPYAGTSGSDSKSTGKAMS